MASDITVVFCAPQQQMSEREVLQWRQRVYEALKNISDAVEPVVVTDHNDLANNGGANSHASIASHIANSSAHGTGSKIVGINDTQELKNKTIDADENTITNLKHGDEVDNPSSRVHGVTGNVVGTTDQQLLTNKTELEPMTKVISNYAIKLTDKQIWFKLLGLRVTLPDATTCDGQIFRIYNGSNGNNQVWAQTGQTIWGETKQLLYSKESIFVQSIDGNWEIV